MPQEFKEAGLQAKRQTEDVKNLGYSKNRKNTVIL